MKWILVLLTVEGGYTSKHVTLDACIRRGEQLTVRGVSTREALCMRSDGQDQIWLVRNGKRERLE